MSVLDLVQQIQDASKQGMHLLALMGALAVPDIAGAAEDPNGVATGQTYATWFDNYLQKDYGGWLSGADCWQLRCSLLHQWSGFAHKPKNYSRVVFSEPRPTGLMHRCILNDVLVLDIPTFCRDMVVAARAWYAARANAAPVATNLAKTIQRHPTGIPPYVIGWPMIG